LSDNPEDYLWDRPQVAYPPVSELQRTQCSSPIRDLTGTQETHPQNGPDLIRLGEKTDVWGIGRIAWTLLVNRLEPGCPVRDKRGKGKDLEGKDMKEYDAFIPLSLDLKVNKTIHNEKTVLTGGSAFPAVGEYTDPTLMNLVRSCLNYNPESRPTLRQIYGAAQDSLQNADEDEDFNKWAYYELMDKDGLNLKLPSHGEFEVGQNFDLASYRMRHEST
jgi:serine/threonine protein kinase